MPSLAWLLLLLCALLFALPLVFVSALALDLVLDSALPLAPLSFAFELEFLLSVALPLAMALRLSH